MELLELKNTLPAVRNSLDGSNHRLDTAEENINEIEGTAI